MKKMLLLLSALIVVPAWAEDAAVAPPPPQAAAQVARATATSSVVIELKGTTKSINALVADLEKERVYQEAACASARKSGKTTKITCAKADSGLMAFLGRYASAKVRWSISGATMAAEAADAPVAAIVQPAAVCPTGCVLMSCPPPGGSYTCCKRTITGYKVCTL